MKKACMAYLGALLLALHLLSSQVVQAQSATDAVNSTVSATVTPAATANVTFKDKNGSGRLDGFTLLLPLALAIPVLLGWPQ